MFGGTKYREITRSIRNKLFVLLMLMGAIPLIVVTMVNAVNLTADLEENAKKVGLLRNTIISQYVTELCEKNFHVLKTLALNPSVIRCLQNPTPQRIYDVENLLRDTDTIFRDKNLTALTAADAYQLIRTDDKPLVNLSGRQHFDEAMRGRTFVSDVLVSRSTGRRIVVIEVPVKDKFNNPIGMVQRNFNLTAMQDFIKNYGTDEISIIIMDREGKTIAHSDDENFSIENESQGDGRYKYIVEQATNFSGTLRLDVDGNDAIVSYSKNWATNWIIVTVQPYSQIVQEVYLRVFQTILLGAGILILILFVSYLLSIKATRPIIRITDAATQIVTGNCNIDKIEIETNDEFGQMAAAFNKMRSARDAYQLEAELDNLTKLYNKATTEQVGKMKLKNYAETDNGETITAFYIIDLDHFKEANDTYGHQFGDKVLTEFSKNLRKKFRPNDCIGRFGGDEFVVIIDKLPNMEIVIRKAQDIKQVAQELTIDGVAAGITASIGIAIVPKDGCDYETVFKAADDALYHVKENGRNGFYYKDAEKIG